jgi:hypothetical protein
VDSEPAYSLIGMGSAPAARNEFPPAPTGRRKHETSFWVPKRHRYDLSETHIVLFLSYL